MIEVRSPATAAEIEAYFELRWTLLRAPWGQPRGSERDELDDNVDAPNRHIPRVTHAAARDASGRLVAVGRLHFNAPGEAQIRYMATIEAYRGRGAGRAVVEHLETAARMGGARRIVLNARDPAVAFYERLGYAAVGPAPSLFGTIPHTRMEKRLEP